MRDVNDRLPSPGSESLRPESSPVPRLHASADLRDDPYLVGSSAVMKETRDKLIRIAQCDFGTWVGGERGTGKGIACRYLHAYGARAQGPYVMCDVNQLGDNRELADLVGVARGAYTGIDHDQPGKIESAHLGVLTLNEIADASDLVQRRLLTLLDDHCFSRLGETRTRTVDVRVVAATNADMAALVRHGKFRADLFDRLGKQGMWMPALREHIEDLRELIAYYLPRKARRVPWSVRDLSPSELDVLHAYSWPGNVRELETTLEHFAMLDELPDDVLGAVEDSRDWRARVDEVLHKHRGNLSAAARELGVSRPTLRAELRRRR